MAGSGTTLIAALRGPASALKIVRVLLRLGGRPGEAIIEVAIRDYGALVTQSGRHQSPQMHVRMPKLLTVRRG
jgi:hypothetical protein